MNDMKNLPVRMARWSAGHPWRAIVCWLLFVVLCLDVGITVGGNPATTEDFRIGEAGRAEAMAAEGGLQQRPVERVLITARPGTGPLDLTAADAAAKDVADMTVWAFRSLVLGVVGILLNLLSAAASLGVLVLVFQDMWAEGLLDFDSTGSIGSRVPLFLFVILFGLSMDYQVFVISRVREAALNGVPTRKAVIDGIGSSAGVVTSAAVVMVTVFASFAALHLIEMKQIGFSLTIAVLLDAFVIRMLILPALMLLLGEANWWPSRGIRTAQNPIPASSALQKAS